MMFAVSRKSTVCSTVSERGLARLAGLKWSAEPVAILSQSRSTFHLGVAAKLNLLSRIQFQSVKFTPVWESSGSWIGNTVPCATI
jgi:hypothetical protein